MRERVWGREERTTHTQTKSGRFAKSDPRKPPLLWTGCRAQYNRTCRKLYDGSCKSKCDSTELEIHRCEAGCVCCGCRAKRKCASRGGLCVPSKAHCEGTAYSAWCDRSCVCCVPGGGWTGSFWVLVCLRNLCIHGMFVAAFAVSGVI